MLGFAVDRNLAYFGAGFSLMAEGQAAHYFFSPPTTTFGLGLGIKYEMFSIAPGAPVSLALWGRHTASTRRWMQTTARFHGGIRF
jgi:hypothetical protein